MAKYKQTTIQTIVVNLAQIKSQQSIVRIFHYHQQPAIDMFNWLWLKSSLNFGKRAIGFVYKRTRFWCKKLKYCRIKIRCLWFGKPPTPSTKHIWWADSECEPVRLRQILSRLFYTHNWKTTFCAKLFNETR